MPTLHTTKILGDLRVTGQTTSTVATGTAPFVIASTTTVPNLNADLLDGQHGWYYAADSTVVKLTGDQTIAGIKTFSSTIVGSISGNAGTVTNGVYTNGSYSNPSWITSLSKSKVDLANVENIALSTWGGTTNLITAGNLTATSLSTGAGSPTWTIDDTTTTDTLTFKKDGISIQLIKPSSSKIIAFTDSVPNVGALKTDNDTAQTASASESFTTNINLHKIAKTGTYGDLIDIPSTFAPIIGSGANQAVAGNDSRLTDTRTPKPHNLIDTTNHTVSGLTTGHFLKATSATTYGFSAHGLTAADVGARASTWVPSWSEVTGKIGSVYGTTAGTFAEGNHNHNGLIHRGNITNFDTTYTEGTYGVAGTSLTGAPYTGNIYGKLIVTVNDGTTHNETNNWIWQNFEDTSGRRYFRWKVNNGSWNAWKVKYDSLTTNIGTGATNYAAGNHNHSGVYEPTFTILATNKGGTGISTFGTANQLLRVNSTATALEYFTPSWLTSGSTLDASKLSGIIPSTVLENSTLYVGTTAVPLNRASATLALTGVTNTNWDAAYNHTSLTNNPHSVNASQIGLGTTSTPTFAGIGLGAGTQTWQITDSSSNLLFQSGTTPVTKATLYNNGDLTITGKLSATSKSFLIDHPTKNNYKLQYGSLEGPENGVYVRGRLEGTNIINLPEYWTKLVDENTITVSFTPVGRPQKLFVEKIKDNKIFIKNRNFFNKSVNCFYIVYAERKDIDKLDVEIEVK